MRHRRGAPVGVDLVTALSGEALADGDALDVDDEEKPTATYIRDSRDCPPVDGSTRLEAVGYDR